uniref:Ubiquitin carboxyl-terminal hydrolase 25-like n=2 Tax=Hirondellea gigas TaxID=1518452 RepID=A0A6A7FR87_9CRUS
MIVSAEDREVSRALEESLREFPSGAIKKKSNPLERKREPGVPVGLVNIGNSCWFNVVSQPLFHLPGFRDMILNYKLSNSSVSSPNSKEKVQTPKVALALSKLFALMLASEQKYIAPTECVCLFQGTEAETRRNEQEDVCEFIHKLLEKLELEFNEVMRDEGEEKESSGQTKDVQFTNPMMKLFYGQFRKDNINSLNSDEDYGIKQETFGQYPLHVLKYGDIHDSILASMSGRRPDRQKKCDSFPEDGSTSYVDEEIQSDGEVQQESWFKLLPPVLIFSLSRYEFSHSTQRAEKVHNKFEFPERLYMDRYMESNKQLVRQKHVQVAAIRKQLAKLNNSLKQYQQFGNGENKYPLKDILAYSLEFAETETSNQGRSHEASNISTCMKEDLKTESSEMTEVSLDREHVGASDSIQARDGTAIVSTCNLLNQIQENKPEPIEGMEVDSSDETTSGSDKHSQKDSLTVTYGHPTRSNISAEELNILRRCLSQWQGEVRVIESELCGHISEMENRLKHMYSDPELLRTAYQLHAVVVHEGQASAGHYWVYIRDHNCWRKYNDVQVSKSSWEELQQDSLGGQNNASAYCLMYTDTNRHRLLYPNNNNDGVTDNDNLHDLLQILPIQLQEYVKQDNMAFQEEISRWENRGSIQAAACPVPIVPQQQQTSHSSRGAVPPPTAPNSPTTATAALDQENLDAHFFVSIDTIIVTVMQDMLQKETLRAQKLTAAAAAAADNVAKAAEDGDAAPVAGGSTDSSPQKVPTIYEVTISILHGSVEKISKAAKHYATVSNLPSLLDFGIFMLHSSPLRADKIIHFHACLMLKHLALATSSTPLIEGIICQCNRLINRFCTTSLGKAYMAWQMKYKLLLDTAWHFVCGWKTFDNESCHQALPIFLKCYRLHKDLISLRTTEQQEFIGNSNLCIVREDVLIESRCKCLLAVNASLIDKFLESLDRSQAEEVVLSITDLVVPALGELSNQGKECEAGAAVRNQWCQLLEKELPAHCGQLIQRVLEAVLSADSNPQPDAHHSGASANSRYKALPVNIKPIPSATVLYKEYNQLLNKLGVNTTSL